MTVEASKCRYFPILNGKQAYLFCSLRSGRPRRILTSSSMMLLRPHPGQIQAARNIRDMVRVVDSARRGN